MTKGCHATLSVCSRVADRRVTGDALRQVSARMGRRSPTSGGASFRRDRRIPPFAHADERALQSAASEDLADESEMVKSADGGRHQAD